MTAKSLSVEGGALDIPEPVGGGVRVYKGIPYAAPPLGRLRWRPPEPVPAWTGVRPSNAFGPNSLQGVVWGDIDPLRGRRLRGLPLSQCLDARCAWRWRPIVDYGLDSRRRICRGLRSRASL